MLRKIRLFTACLCLAILVHAGSSGLARSPEPRQAANPHCPALPAPVGRTVEVDNEDELWNAVNEGVPNTTILLADGTYHLAAHGYYLWIDTPNVTLRSASGNLSVTRRLPPGFAATRPRNITSLRCRRRCCR